MSLNKCFIGPAVSRTPRNEVNKYGNIKRTHGVKINFHSINEQISRLFYKFTIPTI